MKYTGELYVEGKARSTDDEGSTKGYARVKASHLDIAVALSQTSGEAVDAAIRYASDIHKYRIGTKKRY